MNSKAIRKQLLAAVAMVLVAAVALGSSTYAWFVASGTVEATGMKVQVQSEGGIMIKAYGSSDAWASSAVAKDTATKKLYPISTNDLTNWYHATSDKATDAKAQQGKTDYEKITASLDSYRRVDSFIIRPSSGTAITDAKLHISSVTVSEGNATQNLNKAIRVGVKMVENGRILSESENGAKFYIYAPRNDETFTLTAKYISDTTTLEEKTEAGNQDFLYLSDDTIPAADTGVRVEIYVWYEGEDAECKTANLFNGTTALTPDELTVTVQFTQVASDLTEVSST